MNTLPTTTHGVNILRVFSVLPSQIVADMQGSLEPLWEFCAREKLQATSAIVGSSENIAEMVHTNGVVTILLWCRPYNRSQCGWNTKDADKSALHNESGTFGHIDENMTYRIQLA